MSIRGANARSWDNVVKYFPRFASSPMRPQFPWTMLKNKNISTLRWLFEIHRQTINILRDSVQMRFHN